MVINSFTYGEGWTSQAWTIGKRYSCLAAAVKWRDASEILEQQITKENNIEYNAVILGTEKHCSTQLRNKATPEVTFWSILLHLFKQKKIHVRPISNWIRYTKFFLTVEQLQGICYKKTCEIDSQDTQGLIQAVFDIGTPILGTLMWACPNLTLNKTETTIMHNSSFLIKSET